MTDTTPSRNKILVTGANSGLGKFIASQIDCDTLTRSNSHSFLGQVQVPSYDVIIHCAFNSKKDVKNYYDIVQDNIFLTKDLCQISHKKFVFLSSVDVYEEENNLYKTSKLMSESNVKNLATKPLILRCSAILGKTMRKNNFRKIIEDDAPELSLTSGSTFNYVLQEDILEFINIAIQKDYTGIVDFISSTNITLQEISGLVRKQVRFGNYEYKTPKLSSEDLAAVFPKAALSSKKNILRYLKDRK
jgi:nucleoside-diphosphate-sugar epimerase